MAHDLFAVCLLYKTSLQLKALLMLPRGWGMADPLGFQLEHSDDVSRCTARGSQIHLGIRGVHILTLRAQKDLVNKWLKSQDRPGHEHPLATSPIMQH